MLVAHPPRRNVSKWILASIVLLLLTNAAATQASSCQMALSTGSDTSSLKMVIPQSSLETSFEDWVKQPSNQPTCLVLKRLGLKPEVSYLPLRRAYAEMAAGKADIMHGVDYVFDAKTRCHIKLIPFRYYKIPVYYFATQRHSDEPKKLEDFEGKQIMSLSPGLFSKLSNIKVKALVASDVNSMLSLARQGRAEYLIHSQRDIQAAVKTFKLTNPHEEGQFFEVAVPLDVRFSGLLFNTKRSGMSELAAKIEVELQQLRKEGSFQQIVKKDPGFLLSQAPDSMFTEMTKINKMKDNIVCE